MTFRAMSFVPSKWLPVVIIVGLGLVYLLFPTQNSTADAYDYAASVRWQVDLWKPHHLLYNLLGLGMYQLTLKLGLTVAPLALLQALNALAGTASLWVLWRILAVLQKDPRLQAGLLLLAGASLGPMRYATENETYLLPLFFSLLGSYCWIKYQSQPHLRFLLWSSFWAALACLFHQIHFFWWLGLLVSSGLMGKKKGRSLLLFLLPALVVPLGYGWAMHIQEIPIWQAHQFVFQDFYKDGVETTITYKNFLLTGISLLRTFFEVHGRMYSLVQHNLLYIFPALVTFILLTVFLFRFLKTWSKSTWAPDSVMRSHGFIMGLQVLFAWFAVGNAEFLVMLPFLLAILLSCGSFPDSSLFFWPGLGLLVWNLAYAVWPNANYSFNDHACVLEQVKKDPKAILLLQDKNSFDTYLFYHTGHYHPAAYESWADPALLTKVVSQALDQKKTVLTDFSPRPAAISRAWFFQDQSAGAFFQKYQLQPVAHCPKFIGDRDLYMLNRLQPVSTK